jgi:hypothetical protein
VVKGEFTGKNLKRLFGKATEKKLLRNSGYSKPLIET